MDFGKLFSEYGLIGIIVGTLFFIVWRMLVWIMAFVREITKQQTEERMAWRCTLDKHNDLILKIANSIDEHDNRANERGNFVRDEHKQMLETLMRINGYRKNNEI